MPKTLTADPTNFPNVTVPTSGESRTASSVETPFQNLTDRTASLKQRLDLIDPTVEGVRKLRSFASIAALRASSDLGGICHVDGVGLFYYAAGSNAIPQEPFVVQPTSVGGGNGRWLWEAYGSLNVANGIPQLDSSGRIPTSLLPAGVQIVQTKFWSKAGPFSTTSASYENVGTVGSPDATGVQVYIASDAGDKTFKAGDILCVFGQAVVEQTVGAVQLYSTRWAITASSETSYITAIERTPDAVSRPVGMPIGFALTVPEDRIQVLATLEHKIAGGATGTIRNVFMTALHLRP